MYNTHATALVLKVLDLADIVGSVGGALGLFLGFSCLATIQSLLERFSGQSELCPNIFQ